MFTLRKTETKDLPQLMEIFSQAQEYLRQNNVDQWQDGYPTEELLLNDIANGHSYVLTSQDKIVATTMISFDGEPDYDQIYEGQWLSRDPFAVIHRIATDNRHRGSGAAAAIIQAVEDMCLQKGVTNIKIDTHRDNLTMQKFLKKQQFHYRGIIYLQDGSERFAFEKPLT